MTGHKFATSVGQARAIKQALRGFLFCPHCGVTDVGCLLHQRSMSSFSLRCGACGLLYHVKRADLAASARALAAQSEDESEAQLYERVAVLFEPDANARHQYPAVPPELELEAEV
jgi:transcription elongation factor Elf1